MGHDVLVHDNVALSLVSSPMLKAPELAGQREGAMTEGWQVP